MPHHDTKLSAKGREVLRRHLASEYALYAELQAIAANAPSRES